MVTLLLSFLVSVGTLLAMALAGFGFFVSAGVIYPAIVAWAVGSLFAFERRPRHLWLHVAVIGVFVAALINFYGFAMLRLFSHPPGAPGGANMPAIPIPPTLPR
jgi:hypothetical protein